MAGFAEMNTKVSLTVGAIAFIVVTVFSATTIYYQFQQNIDAIEGLKEDNRLLLEMLQDMDSKISDDINGRMDRKCGRNADDIKDNTGKIQEINHSLIGVGIVN